MCTWVKPSSPSRDCTSASPRRALSPLVIALRLPQGNCRPAVSLWIALHLLEFDVNGFAQPMLFWVWLFPLNVIVVRCVRVVCGFYFWVASLAWTHASLLTHSPVINLPLLYDATADGNMAGTQRGHLASKRARTHLCCQQAGREAA